MPAKQTNTFEASLTDDRRKALNLAIAQIEKVIGKGSIMRMGQETRVAIGAIPTGAINLDAAIGIGGVPRGRITEIYGPESSGKTTLALHIAANAQRLGGVASFIDAEHALDVEYAKKLGVDLDNLLVSQPDTGEEALEIAEILVRSGAVDVIVVDSVAALVPKAEIEGDMGDAHVGLQARLMSQALRKLAGSINRSRTSVIFINQLREKIGVMFGNPETTTGGRALKFYSSARLDVRRIGPVKERDEITGSKVRVKVVKNKVAPPFRQAEFDIMFSEGISHVSLLVDLGVEAGVIEKSGAWYSYGKERIGQGRENAKLFLKDHPVMADEIEVSVKAFLGITQEDEGSEANPQLDDKADGDDSCLSALRRVIAHRSDTWVRSIPSTSATQSYPTRQYPAGDQTRNRHRPGQASSRQSSRRDQRNAVCQSSGGRGHLAPDSDGS
jgi:recombination protein RecA